MAVSTKNTQQKSGHHLIAKPGFLRRLAAMFYDLLLLIAVLFVATALLLPLNSGQAFTAQQFLFPLYLLLVSFFFYAWFWTHGGQTLGLRAWKIKVLTLDRKPLTWKQALLRFSIAILSWGFLGLGVLWILIDKNQRSWHDHLSKTALFFDTHDSDH
ncbi:MAG: RDD family protein [Methylobacter sp.]|uniref:RDD family protein n=1 Tax=Candidatus Methylobacter titanis TaxID=3053457 RepID=A0AA43Q2C0_9GAMM|nr:RDD family protein [Candidatus Methylobacter titanis]MDI1293670.1 RDD family protein [Candidatus Methylobacter titanis]